MLEAFSLSRQDTALAIVDVQEKLAAVMPPERLATVIRNTRILAQGMQAVGVPVLMTEQYPRGLGPTVAGVREAFETPLQPLEKTAFDAACADGFVPKLEAWGTRSVVLAGMEAHICVLQSAVGLRRRGYHVWIAEDAICSRIDANREAALRLLAGLGAIVAPTEAILFLLIGGSSDPAFKTISRIVR